MTSPFHVNRHSRPWLKSTICGERSKKEYQTWIGVVAVGTFLGRNTTCWIHYPLTGPQDALYDDVTEAIITRTKNISLRCKRCAPKSNTSRPKTPRNVDRHT